MTKYDPQKKRDYHRKIEVSEILHDVFLKCQCPRCRIKHTKKFRVRMGVELRQPRRVYCENCNAIAEAAYDPTCGVGK